MAHQLLDQAQILAHSIGLRAEPMPALVQRLGKAHLMQEVIAELRDAPRIVGAGLAISPAEYVARARQDGHQLGEHERAERNYPLPAALGAVRRHHEQRMAGSVEHILAPQTGDLARAEASPASQDQKAPDPRRRVLERGAHVFFADRPRQPPRHPGHRQIGSRIAADAPGALRPVIERPHMRDVARDGARSEAIEGRAPAGQVLSAGRERGAASDLHESLQDPDPGADRGRGDTALPEPYDMSMQILGQARPPLQ